MNLEILIDKLKVFSYSALKLNIPLPLRVKNTVGQYLLEQGRPKEAMQVFENIGKHHPKNAQGFIGNGMAAIKIKDWQTAIRSFKKGLEIMPENKIAMYQLGIAQTKIKAYEAATTTFEKLIQLYPTDHFGYEGLAFVLNANFNFKEANKWLKISIDKTHQPTSYVKRARLLIRFAYFDEGFKLLEELIRKKNNPIHLQIEKANLLLIANKYKEAVELLAELFEKKPTKLIKRLYAQSLIGAKQYDEASQIIDQISSSDPDLTQLKSTHPEMIIRYLKTWQKYYKEGPVATYPKVFGIGLSRTGTSSLTKALDLLGFTTIHFINPITKRVIDIDDFYYYDAFTDSPVAYRFEELYQLFPNAKFIYTERNLDDWVRSNSNLYKPMKFSTTLEMKEWLNQPKGDQFNKLFQNYHPTYHAAYESLYADFPNWETAYHAFEKRVDRFFEDKPTSSFLKINIPDGDGWIKLCHFLEVPIPKYDFPHRNKLTSNES
ncbi:MAG: tetratricopeptide repeat protein [Saprospiraceae bacterium]|nr:tetratricopeptide repeat protein [Saprospiraceae bacterium]